MSNFFDQFDQPAQAAPQAPAAGGNFFDQFDQVEAVDAAAGRLSGGLQTVREASSALPDNTGSVAVGRGILDGVPIVGPYLLGGVERGVAGIRSLQSGNPYADELATVQREGRQIARENPGATLGGNIAGGVAGTIPAAAAAPAVFGLSQVSLPARVIASTTSGTAIGGADAAVRSGGEWEKTRNGALWGGVFGLAAPIAGQVVGAGVRRAWNALTNRPANGMSGAAAGMLADDVRTAGGVPAIRQRMAELGPDAMLLDAAPSFEGRAQGAVVRPETRQQIIDALVGRNAGKNARLASDLDAAIGPAPVPSQIEGGLAASRNLTAEAYGPAMHGARAVDTRMLANNLEDAAINLRGPAQRAVRDVRRMLDIPGAAGHLDPSPQALLNTRQAIDGLLTNEQNPQVIRQLTMARQAVDVELTRAVPGIKAVDARYAELARQSEGLQRGTQVLDSGRTSPRPAELAQELTQGAQPQGHMVGPSAVPFRMRQGARAEIDRQVGTKANDLVALRNVVKGEGDWNRTRLTQLFGRENAERVLSAVDREAAFERVYNQVVNNSMTSVRERAAAGMAPRGEGSATPDVVTALAGATGGVPGIAAATGARAGRAIMNDAARASDIARNQQVARALIQTSGPELDTLLATLGRRASSLGAVDRNAQAVDRIATLLLEAQGPRAQDWMPRFSR